MLVDVVQSVALIGTGGAAVALSYRAVHDRDRLRRAERAARQANALVMELQEERRVERRRALSQKRRSARWLFRQWLVSRGWQKPRESDLPTSYDGQWS